MGLRGGGDEAEKGVNGEGVKVGAKVGEKPVFI